MPKVTLLSHSPDPQRTIAAAARLCYSSATVDELYDNLTPEKAEELVSMLVDIGHESPVEHVAFTFALEGVSRALLAQITRHRIASFSVQSQRYVGESSFDYVTPPAIAQNPEVLAKFENAMRAAQESYNHITDMLVKQYRDSMIQKGEQPANAARKAIKMAQEDARFVLPNACDTKMILTMNARSLQNFFTLRCCNRAQWEIRAVAEEMLRLVLPVAPVLFGRAGPPCVRGPCPEGKMACGNMIAVQEKYNRLKSKLTPG